MPNEIDPSAQTAVCCGPNTVYFSRRAKLCEMVDHIYGRAHLPLSTDRPHMFLKELSLHLDRMKQEVERRGRSLVEARPRSTDEVKENLLGGIRHYRNLASRLAAGTKDEFLAKLESLRGELDRIID